MSTGIYQDVLLAHYHAPHNFGRLKNPTHSASLNNPLCGDSIVVDITSDGTTVHKIMFEGEGCVLSKASASLLTDFARGKKLQKVRALDTSAMLELTHVTVGPTRLKCILLPLEAVQKALA